HVRLGGSGGWSSPIGQEVETGASTLSAKRREPHPNNGVARSRSATSRAGMAPERVLAIGSPAVAEGPRPKLSGAPGAGAGRGAGGGGGAGGGAGGRAGGGRGGAGGGRAEAWVPEAAAGTQVSAGSAAREGVDRGRDVRHGERRRGQGADRGRSQRHLPDV